MMSLNRKGRQKIYLGLRNEQTATELAGDQTQNRLKMQFEV